MNPPSSNEPLANPLLAFRVLLGIGLCGVVGVLAFALQATTFRHFGSLLGVALITALAALLTGGVLGFLFGIPRTQVEKSDPKDGKTDTKRAAEQYIANTNLEQISDWLTKILVGVGLTQIEKVPSLLTRVGEAMSRGLPESVGSATFGAALMVLFLLGGFLLGWLWARLYLRSVFLKVDRDLEEVAEKMSARLEELSNEVPDDSTRLKIREIQQDVDRHMPVEPSPAKDAIGKVQALATDYEAIRATMPSGFDRTAKMGSIIAKSRGTLRQFPVEPAQIIDLFQRGGEGNRIVALGLSQVVKHPTLIRIAIDSIGAPRSSFEQYQALRVLEEQLPTCSDQDKQRIKDSVLRARGAGGSIDERNARDRYRLSGRILQSIG